MKIETVSALFGVREKPEHEFFNLATMKFRVPVTELLIHMNENGEDSIRDVVVDGTLDTNRKAEHERLARIYRREILHQVYPNQMTPLPLRLADIDIEPSYMGTPRPLPVEEPAEAPAAPKAKAVDPFRGTVNVKAEKDAIRKRLDELDYKTPFGNFGIEKLRGFLAEAEASIAA
jgi:hypothetical protein